MLRRASNFCFFVSLFCFLGAKPVAHGGSQARGLIRATAADPHHSHRDTRSKPCLRPTPQLTATPDPSPTERGPDRPRKLMDTSQVRSRCVMTGTSLFIAFASSPGILQPPLNCPCCQIPTLWALWGPSFQSQARVTVSCVRGQGEGQAEGALSVSSVWPGQSPALGSGGHGAQRRLSSGTDKVQERVLSKGLEHREINIRAMKCH